MRHKIVVGILAAALAFVTYVSIVQASAIQRQRLIIRELVQYVQEGCPDLEH
jgi:hypothetical protein